MLILQSWKNLPFPCRLGLLLWFFVSTFIMAFFVYVDVVENNIREAQAFVTQYNTSVLPGSRWTQAEVDTVVNQQYLNAFILIGSICLVFLIFFILLTLILSNFLNFNLELQNRSSPFYFKLFSVIGFLTYLVLGSLGELIILALVYGDSGSSTIGEKEHYTYQYVGMVIGNHRYARAEADTSVFGAYFIGFVEFLILSLFYVSIYGVAMWILTRSYQNMRQLRLRKQ